MRQATRFAVQPGWKLVLTDMGLNPADVLAHAGLPADLFSRRNAWLTPAEYFRLWHGLEAAVGGERLPLLVGQSISVEAFDPPVFASLCSPNLNVALARLGEYKRLVCPMRLNLSIRPEHTEISIECYGYDRPLPRSLGATELIFLTQLARIATRHPVKPLFCELETLPENRQACEEFLGCALRQGKASRIAFSAQDATRPFLTENVAMWEFFETDLQTRLSKLEVGANIRDRVRGALLDMLPSGQSSLEEVASRLAMSKRSLQRHLAVESASYQDVLDETRRDLAHHYLTRSTIAPGEISYLIGFQDVNSFVRAFKGWTGHTPGEYRRSNVPHRSLIH